MKKKIVKCHCGARAFLRHASAVHGEKARDEYLYVCSRYPACDSYVSVHAQNLKPQGTPADDALRRKRMEAHRAFDALWKSGLMRRWNAYNWLRARFGLARGRTHIAMFSEYMCEQVARECKAFMENQQNYRKAG